MKVVLVSNNIFFGGTTIFNFSFFLFFLVYCFLTFLLSFITSHLCACLYIVVVGNNINNNNHICTNLVGLLLGVGPPVRGEVDRRGEPLATISALIVLDNKII